MLFEAPPLLVPKKLALRLGMLLVFGKVLLLVLPVLLSFLRLKSDCLTPAAASEI